MISIIVEIIDKSLSIDPDEVKSIAKTVLGESKLEEGELTIIFAQEEFLRQMKKSFFNKDVYTDVIAFHLNDQSEPFEGEIYISPIRASENAKKLGETVPDEIARLICHGCLHLLGYEDQSDSGKLAMRSEEDRFVKLFSSGQILNK